MLVLRNIKQVRVKVLRVLSDLQLYDTEFQPEGALTLKAFTDKAMDIHSTVNSNLSANHTQHLS